ncbi:MAG: hypothetical protein QM707_03685 [Arenimonas sp.]
MDFIHLIACPCLQPFGGSDWDEIVMQAKAIEPAGATIISTGIGWHEARVPTIATSVPRAAFAGVTAKLKPHVHIPLVATNRINMPEVAERILLGGQLEHGVDGAPPSGGSPLGREGARRPQRTHEYLHRLQSGLPGPHLHQPHGELPGESTRLRG